MRRPSRSWRVRWPSWRSWWQLVHSGTRSESWVRWLSHQGMTWWGTVRVWWQPAVAQVGPHLACRARRSRRLGMRRVVLAPTGLPAASSRTASRWLWQPRRCRVSGGRAVVRPLGSRSWAGRAPGWPCDGVEGGEHGQVRRGWLAVGGAGGGVGEQVAQGVVASSADAEQPSGGVGAAVGDPAVAVGLRGAAGGCGVCVGEGAVPRGERVLVDVHGSAASVGSSPASAGSTGSAASSGSTGSTGPVGASTSASCRRRPRVGVGVTEQWQRFVGVDVARRRRRRAMRRRRHFGARRFVGSLLLRCGRRRGGVRSRWRGCVRFRGRAGRGGRRRRRPGSAVRGSRGRRRAGRCRRVAAGRAAVAVLS